MSTRPSIKERVAAILGQASPVDWTALGFLGVYFLSRIPIAMGKALPHPLLLTFIALFAAGYLLVRVILIGRRSLLWRLRNRLIVAYIFIAVVPILLLVTMVGLAGYLLE